MSGKKYSGGTNRSSSFKINKAEPSDDREVVELLSDLLTLEYAYPLIKVKVEEDGNTYQWVGGVQNNAGNWVDKITVLQGNVAAISSGEGTTFATRTLAAASPEANGNPFVVYGEPGFNGQYRFDSTNVDDYVVIKLFKEDTDDPDATDQTQLAQIASVKAEQVARVAADNLKLNKSDSPIKNIVEEGAFLSDENGNAFLSFLDGIGVDMSKVSDSLFQKILTLLNIAQGAGDSASRPISQAAFTAILAENDSTKNTIEDGAFFCNENGEVFASFKNGVFAALGLGNSNTPTINAIEDVANVLGGNTGQYLKKNADGNWEGSNVVIPTQSLNSLSDVNAPYTEGAVLQFVGGKVVPASIDLNGVISTDSRVGHPLYGKHFFVFGDSHTAFNVGWWQRLVELTGAIYHTLQLTNVNGEFHYFTGTFVSGDAGVTEVDTGIVANCDKFNWAQYAHVAYTHAASNGFSIDYILVQNSHFGEWNFYNNDNSLKENIPVVLLNPTQTYSTIFADASAAAAFRNQDSNIALIVSELGLNTIDSSFYLRYGTSTQELTFTFSSGSVLDTNVTVQLYFGSDASNFISVNLTSGMTISEVTDAINQWDFEQFSTWINPTKSTTGNTSIVLNYSHTVSGDGDSLATLVPLGSNLRLTTPEITAGYTRWPHLYGLKDTSGLNLSASWLKTGGNVNWSLPNAMLGALQYMGENSPLTKFVFIGVPNNSFDASYVYADGSVNPYGMMNGSSYTGGTKSRKSTKDFANLFGQQYIEINDTDGVSAFNVYPTFNSLNDVHCNATGYQLWAEIVSKNIK
jgi:hypothetical protein